MQGCCGRSGGGGKGQNNQRDRKEDARARRDVTSSPTPNRGKNLSSQHDEEVCHGTGERRRDLLDQLKSFLTEFDDKPCMVKPPEQGPNAKRSLGSYPEYLKKHCQSWMPPTPKPPIITSVQTHEIRASSDYDKAKKETSEYLSFTDATLRKPVFTCECVKRNGLQDRCSHPMCKPPTAQCLATNPGPCCPPSMGLGGPEAVLGGSKGNQGSGQAQEPPPRTEYQDGFVYRQPGTNQQVPAQPPPPTYTTTYRQDYLGLQERFGHQEEPTFLPNRLQMGNQQQPGPSHRPMGAGVPQPPPGMEMVCLCKASSSALPSGKKYLCCPLPQ